ncbi:MAG: hypothetical protein WCF19_01085 [Chlamydiales bacterium]
MNQTVQYNNQSKLKKKLQYQGRQYHSHSHSHNGQSINPKTSSASTHTRRQQRTTKQKPLSQPSTHASPLIKRNELLEV